MERELERVTGELVRLWLRRMMLREEENWRGTLTRAVPGLPIMDLPEPMVTGEPVPVMVALTMITPAPLPATNEVNSEMVCTWMYSPPQPPSVLAMLERGSERRRGLADVRAHYRAIADVASFIVKRLVLG